MKMRAVLGLVACLASMPILAKDSWQIMTETPAEVISIDLTSFQRSADIVGFRERHVMRGEQFDPGSQRPVREVLARRLVDCNTRRTATLSSAVFSDDDALIDYHAVRQPHAKWQLITNDDPIFRRVCGHS
jgi:hypothetical protein